jgi:8-oxo-dGTP pyrophosphatase MutT (NUDIX family)
MNTRIYRVSAKALIFDEDHKILLVKEKRGWELPGGGIEQGESPQETITREITEECGFEIEKINESPSLMWIINRPESSDELDRWRVLIGFETKLKSLEFTPSKEALEYRFVSKEEMEDLDLHPNIEQLPELLTQL